MMSTGQLAVIGNIGSPESLITGTDPEARLGEIMEILRSRRDGLVDFLARYFEAGGARQEGVAGFLKRLF